MRDGVRPGDDTDKADETRLISTDALGARRQGSAFFVGASGAQESGMEVTIKIVLDLSRVRTVKDLEAVKSKFSKLERLLLEMTALRETK